ncbi:hypothetical protein GGR50DRAFT_681060 [Xylaria sp. CBS 124048]|nr:hypothetical protein GGR50DRAFT_681060 [Xylaria sp. CBS 124048]
MISFLMVSMISMCEMNQIRQHWVSLTCFLDYDLSFAFTASIFPSPLHNYLIVFLPVAVRLLVLSPRKRVLSTAGGSPPPLARIFMRHNKSVIYNYIIYKCRKCAWWARIYLRAIIVGASLALACSWADLRVAKPALPCCDEYRFLPRS